MRIRRQYLKNLAASSAMESEKTSKEVSTQQKRDDSRCFSVVEENRRITWSACYLFKSQCRSSKRERAYDRKVKIDSDVTGSVYSDLVDRKKGKKRGRKKGRTVCKSSQVQALQGGKDNKSRSTSICRDQMNICYAYGEGNAKENRDEEEIISLKKGRGRYRENMKGVMKYNKNEKTTKEVVMKTMKHSGDATMKDGNREVKMIKSVDCGEEFSQTTLLGRSLRRARSSRLNIDVDTTPSMAAEPKSCN